MAESSEHNNLADNKRLQRELTAAKEALQARERELAQLHSRGEAEARAHLAAVVECSDDAIISKTLEGIIKTWNTGAQRIFGYTADEVIGKPITILMPPERENEEPAILERIKRGERIDHYQ